jgi:hypothetical protein
MKGKDIEHAASPMILDQVEEQETGLYFKMEVKNRAVLKQDPKPIVKQKSVIIYVRRPQIIEPKVLAEIEKKARQAEEVAAREQGRSAAAPSPAAAFDRSGESARAMPKAGAPSSEDEGFKSGFGPQGKP